MSIIDSMDQLAHEADRRGPSRLDLVLALIVTVIAAATVFILMDPDLSLAVFDRSLDVTINALVALSSLSLSALALGRYREGQQVAGLFQSSAFLLIGVVSAANVILVLLKIDGMVGLTLGIPEQWPLYVWTFAPLFSAALLLAGGIAAMRGLREISWGVRKVLLVPILAIAVLTVVVYALNPLLPPFVDPEGIRQLIEEPIRPGRLESVTGISVLFHGIGASLFMAAAWTYRQSFARSGPAADAYLAVGLVITGFAEIHAAFYPGSYTQLASSGDALRLAGLIVLVLGVDAEARSDIRALRAAYRTLERLRQNEAERAALEERARLAREIHDGLAQDLWFAKLKHERLAPLVPEEARELSMEVTQALDAAIAEAKHAVVTMRTGVDENLPLPDLLARLVQDFGTRSGVRVEYTASPLPMTLSPRRQAELLRVVQEALTNVSKHADATVVRVKASIEDEELEISVVDNGRGFNVASAPRDRMGLRSMTERARLMGGKLGVASEPSDGTVITLRIPLAEPRPTQLAGLEMASEFDTGAYRMDSGQISVAGQPPARS